MARLATTTEYSIYSGVWTNWSYGQISGLTLTLTHRNGAFLTAFLALFVTFTGTCFWRIVKFAIHQYLSTAQATDGLYHQTQLILRNSTSETNSLLDLLRVLMAWRRGSRRPFCRIIPLIVITSILVATFAAGGILSAKIGSEMGDEVLLSSPNCGQLYLADNITADTIDSIFNPWYARKLISLANFAQRCYTDITSEDCTSYVKPKLTSLIDRNAPCPFREKICRHQDQNIILDTGDIDLHSDLGMNTPSNLRTTMKRITHCAPLATDSYTTLFNYSNDISYKRYFYGVPTIPFGNFTYTYQQTSIPQKLSERGTQEISDYNLG